jgi:hypothetical protein
MAILVPDNLGSRKDVAEAIRRVANAFQTGLDDDVVVWYEPPYDPTNERPHLVVLEPRIGVVVLEVLKGKQGSVLGALRGRIRLEVDGTEVEVSDPLERAERFAASLRELIADRPGLRDVPIGAVAVLSGMDRSEAESKKVDKVVDLEHAVFKPDLDAAIAEGNGAPILRAFRRAAARGVDSNADLTRLQVDEMRGVIHPDVVIEPTAEQGTLFTRLVSDDIVNVMDIRQEALAKSLGNGHRVIRGVAGSGKTLVLVHRAKLLATVMPTQRILFTCFTKSLASQLRMQLSEYPSIEIEHLDSVMARTIKAAGLKHPGYTDRTRTVASVALRAQQQGGIQPYRAVLVDEAQDFDAQTLEFCVKLLANTDPEQQDLVIVADSAQNIFKKKFRWKDAGIQAQGRTRILRINYRNTRQVLEFAHNFLTADPAISVDEVPGDEDELTIIPAESAERDGAEPEAVLVDGTDAEIQAVVETVHRRLANRTASRSIAVLYGERSPGDSDRGEAVSAALDAAGISHFWVTDPKSQDNKHRAGSAEEPVIVSTIHSAKGLEYPHVIVCGLGVRDDEITARKLLYVGFTRATSDLTVVTDSASPFADALR